MIEEIQKVLQGSTIEFDRVMEVDAEDGDYMIMGCKLSKKKASSSGPKVEGFSGFAGKSLVEVIREQLDSIKSVYEYEKDNSGDIDFFLKGEINGLIIALATLRQTSTQNERQEMDQRYLNAVTEV